MSSIVPPAASIAAFTFSQTWRVCASMSPAPTTLPSLPFATMPEMNTRRPFASMPIAWAKWPDGAGSCGLRISFLGMDEKNGVCPRLFEDAQRLVGGEHVAELLDDVLQRGEVLGVGKRGGAVGEQHHLVVEHHRVARGALAADVGLGAGDEERVDAPLGQH